MFCIPGGRQELQVKESEELKKQLIGKEEALKGKAREPSRRLGADNEAKSSTVTELKQVKISPETDLANNETKMKDKNTGQRKKRHKKDRKM